MDESRDLKQYPTFRDGDEPFQLREAPVGFTLYDYWRWMGSDLVYNIQRGVVAEYIVSKALEAETLKYPRAAWESFDVQIQQPEYGTIEVKSSAYIQSWHKKNTNPSSISFDITPKKHSRDFYVDAYVFCLLGKPPPAPFPNPLDLDQWKFYVLMSVVLDEEVRDQKSIGLHELRDLVNRKGSMTNYDGLRNAVEESFERYPPEGEEVRASEGT